MARWYIYRVADTVHIDVQMHTRAKARWMIRRFI